MLHHLTQHLWGVPRTTGEVGLTNMQLTSQSASRKPPGYHREVLGWQMFFSCEGKKWQFCSSNVCSSIFSLNLAKNAHIHQHRTHFISKNKSQAVKPLKPKPFSCEAPPKKTSSARVFSPWMEVWDPPPPCLKAFNKLLGESYGPCPQKVIWLIFHSDTFHAVIFTFRAEGAGRPGVVFWDPPCLDVPGR